MTTKTTEAILSERRVDPKGGYFIDDFLGTNDFTEDGQPLNRAEDRIYTTAMAANTLVYVWSVYDDCQQKLMWKDTVPSCVKKFVKGCSEWLERNTLSGEYATTGPFFCPDIKNRDTMPFIYPFNRFEFLNGTKINSYANMPSEMTVTAMEGYVETEEYESQLKMERFGFHTPTVHHGFNSGQGTLGFWTSDAVTYGAAMMTVSMVQELEG